MVLQDRRRPTEYRRWTSLVRPVRRSCVRRMTWVSACPRWRWVSGSDDSWVEPAAGTISSHDARPFLDRWGGRPRPMRCAGVMNGWSGVGPTSPSI